MVPYIQNHDIIFFLGQSGGVVVVPDELVLVLLEEVVLGLAEVHRPEVVVEGRSDRAADAAERFLDVACSSVS